jgi:hypothetical protein
MPIRSHPASGRDPRWSFALGLALGALGVVAVGFSWSPPQAGRTTQVLPGVSHGGTADSNNRMIAVTGVDVTGQSVLYLVDTEARQLAVYQASGGSSGTQGLKLVGARRIDLDLQLDGFNDKTTNGSTALTYKDLRAQFVEQGLVAPEDE